MNKFMSSAHLPGAGSVLRCFLFALIYLRDFMKSAWADIERFKEQKNHDLKEALISYAVMQISMAKKVSLTEKEFQKRTQNMKC